MNKRHYFALLPLMTLLATGGLAIAQEKGAKDRGHDGQWREGGFGSTERVVAMLKRRLDLDDAQIAEIDNIIGAAKPEMDSLRERARTNREAMRALDVGDADYSAKLQNLAAENGELVATTTLLHGRLRAEIHGVLTPEQQSRMAEAGGNFRDRGRRNRDRSEND